MDRRGLTIKAIDDSLMFAVYQTGKHFTISTSPGETHHTYVRSSALSQANRKIDEFGVWSDDRG